MYNKGWLSFSAKRCEDQAACLTFTIIPKITQDPSRVIGNILIHCKPETNIWCNKNLLWTGRHDATSIRHNFAWKRKRCRFLVVRNFAWGKIDALRKMCLKCSYFFTNMQKSQEGLVISFAMISTQEPLCPCSCMSWLYQCLYHLGPRPNVKLLILSSHFSVMLSNLWIIPRIETNDQQPPDLSRQIKCKSYVFFKISSYILMSKNCGLPIW